MDKKRKVLIALREAKGWKQEDVAKKLDITQQAVSLYENGKRDPSIRLAKKFELLFKMPMEELFPDIFLTSTQQNAMLDNKQNTNEKTEKTA